MQKRQKITTAVLRSQLLEHYTGRTITQTLSHCYPVVSFPFLLKRRPRISIAEGFVVPKQFDYMLYASASKRMALKLFHQMLTYKQFQNPLHLHCLRTRRSNTIHMGQLPPTSQQMLLQSLTRPQKVIPRVRELRIFSRYQNRSEIFPQILRSPRLFRLEMKFSRAALMILNK